MTSQKSLVNLTLPPLLRAAGILMAIVWITAAFHAVSGGAAVNMLIHAMAGKLLLAVTIFRLIRQSIVPAADAVTSGYLSLDLAVSASRALLCLLLILVSLAGWIAVGASGRELSIPLLGIELPLLVRGNATLFSLALWGHGALSHAFHGVGTIYVSTGICQYLLYRGRLRQPWRGIPGETSALPARAYRSGGVSPNRA